MIGSFLLINKLAQFVFGDWQTYIRGNSLGDGITALCCFMMAAGIIYFIWKRRDFEMSALVLVFALFILSSGAIHLLSVFDEWGLNAFDVIGPLKVITALISVITLITLYVKIPKALTMQSPQELLNVNKELYKQIQEKEYLQQELFEKNRTLEKTIKLLYNTQDVAKIGTWQADLTKNQLFWSDQIYKILEIEPGKNISMGDVIHFYRTSHQQEVRETIEKAINEHVDWDKVWQLEIGKENYKWVRTIGYPVVEKGEVVALEGLLMDVDEEQTAKIKLEQYYRELEEKNKELEAYSYSISHDLRAPLRSINGFADILVEDFSETIGEEGRRLLGVIKTNALRMGTLIDDILQYSRVGRRELISVPINMRQLIETLVEELKSTYQHDNVNFMISELEPAKGDPVLIKQAFQNLIDNAIKYSSLNDVIDIQIGCQKQDNITHYFVRDNGIGFDPKYKDKIFGIFQRLHTNNEFSGTGVGLAITKKIVEKHNGTLWAESTLGKGATFYISLGG